MILTDAAILEWFEDRHRLHWGVDILYVVDGYEIQRTYDSNPVGKAIYGETLREAMVLAMQSKEWAWSSKT